MATPSDCTDHGPPFLIYFTCEGQSEPMILTIIESEGGQRHRYAISDNRCLLILSEVAARLAGRPR